MLILVVSERSASLKGNPRGLCNYHVRGAVGGILLTKPPLPYYKCSWPSPFLPFGNTSPHALFIYLLYTSRPISTFACMPLPQPPYPSFTLVMSSPQVAVYDNTRLPAHRASHQNRFHPYPRSHPSFHQERHLVHPRFTQLSSPD